MQLAIPPAPRKVSLRQVPGAVLRLSLLLGSTALLAGLLFGAGGLVGTWASSEREFLAAAVPVTAQVVSVELPPAERHEREPAKLAVIYTLDGVQHGASEVEADAVGAEVLAKGNAVMLLVDPAHPTHPRESAWVARHSGRSTWALGGLWLGLVLGLGFLAFEVRRALRRELLPLRRGMLVWLTPDAELSTSREEQTFPASYWKDDVQYRVRARARPGRAPVRNGPKVLAAVIPSEPQWVRVIDEDLAQTLGWFR